MKERGIQTGTGPEQLGPEANGGVTIVAYMLVLGAGTGKGEKKQR